MLWKTQAHDSLTPLSALRELSIKSPAKIVLLVMDGLGGLPRQAEGATELETARIPNLDALASTAECGMHLPIGFGITPGSVPGHLALFGYDPLEYPVGRGVVSALGIGFPMKEGDVAARMNFATVDESGTITDRRAGRIPTQKCAELCNVLSSVSIKGIGIALRPVKDYRAVVVFHGKGLSDHVADSDPQAVGVKPLEPTATDPQGARMASVAGEFVKQARRFLSTQGKANAILLRGFSGLPRIPSLSELHKVSPVALAVYPDYKGVARMVGMDVVEGLASLDDQAKALEAVWGSHDFFYIHHKMTDSTGEDGDFDGKVKEIEKIDAFLPTILALKPDLVIVTGDHSTPATAKAHTSHPVPFLIAGTGVRADGTRAFGERACSQGAWSIIPAQALIRIALAYTGKLRKFGA